MTDLSKLYFYVLLLFGCICPNLAHALTIESVRFGQHPDKTRLVVEIDQATDYKAFILEAPNRLVIDFPRYQWDAGQISKPKGGLVADIRTGALTNTTSRLVIDLTKPVSIRSAFLLPKTSSKPNRLVVDFVGINASGIAEAKKKTFGTLQSNTEQKTGASFLDLIVPKPAAPSTIPKAENTSQAAAVTPTRKPKQVIKATSYNTAPSSPLRKPLIVIDAGHGGQDPGAIGADNTFEKKITLAAALELKKQLEATGRYSVHLTRSTDKFIKLGKRVNIARQKKADMFISLHADSIGNSNVRGASIYTLSNKASDAQTAKLARRENRADLIAGVDLSHEDKEVADILLDLAMRETMNQSKFFANTVVETLRSRSIKILERPHRYAGFAVLKAPDIPSVLIEMGFMSNRKDVSLLSNSSYRRKMASALVESIDTYFNKVRNNQTH